MVSLVYQHFVNFFLVYFFPVHLRFRPAVFSGINHPLQKGLDSYDEIVIYDALTGEPTEITYQFNNN